MRLKVEDLIIIMARNKLKTIATVASAIPSNKL